MYIFFFNFLKIFLLTFLFFFNLVLLNEVTTSHFDFNFFLLLNDTIQYTFSFFFIPGFSYVPGDEWIPEAKLYIKWYTNVKYCISFFIDFFYLQNLFQIIDGSCTSTLKFFFYNTSIFFFNDFLFLIFKFCYISTKDMYAFLFYNIENNLLFIFSKKILITLLEDKPVNIIYNNFDIFTFVSYYIYNIWNFLIEPSFSQISSNASETSDLELMTVKKNNNFSTIGVTELHYVATVTFVSWCFSVIILDYTLRNFSGLVLPPIPI